MKTITKPIGQAIAPKYGLLDPAPAWMVVNLFQDGDCELSGTAYWSAGNAAVLSKSIVDPYEGSQALRVTAGASNTPYAFQAAIAGTHYICTGRARGNGTAAPRIIDGTGAAVWTGTSSTTWQAITFEVASWLGALVGCASDALGGSGDWVEFDDLRMVKYDGSSEVETQVRAQFDCRLEGGLLYDLDSGVGNAPSSAPKIMQAKTSLGNALNFYDDSANVNTSHIPFSMPSVRSSTFSCEFWYNPSFATGVQRYILTGSGNILAFGTNNWVVEYYNNQIRVFGSAGNIITPASDKIYPGDWRHIAVTASGGIANIYIDGHLSVSGALVLANSNASGEYIGNAQVGGGISSAGGQLAGIRVYSTLRTAAEVQESYDQGARVIEANTADGLKTNTSTAGQTGGFIGGNSPFERVSGTWSVNPDLDATENISKALTCNSSGIVVLPRAKIKSAYGTLSFWVKKQDGSNTVIWWGDEKQPSAAFNGYRLILATTEAISLAKVTAGVATTIMQTGPSVIIPNTWAQYQLLRRYDGQWSLYRNKTLLTVLVGTNPAIENTYKTLEHLVFDFDTGDQLALVGNNPSGTLGTYAFTKYLGVVAP